MAIERFRTASFVFACASWCLVGCQSGSLSPLYCEGGVDANGHELGGKYLAVSKDVLDSDPNSVGTGRWGAGDVTPESSANQYSVRRNGKNHYEMFLNGKLAGTIDRSDHWITVKFADKAAKFSLRDDPPGFFN
jgi:hypothetical protein